MRKTGFDRIESFPPKEDISNIFGHMPASRADQYDTYNIIKCLVDNSEYEEYKPDYGKTIICRYSIRIDGWSVGIVANQRKLVKSGKGEMQFGGVIYSDSADKATRFIANCNQRKNSVNFPSGCYRIYGKDQIRTRRNH